MGTSISVIGIGALGQALVRALHEQSYAIHSVFNRNPSIAEVMDDELDASFSGAFPEEVHQLGDIIFICVSDDAITGVAERLAEKQWDFSGKTVAHCSGNEPSDLLDSLKESGAHTAAFHPLQTFNRNSTPDVFDDIYISLEGDEQAVQLLEKIVKRLDAHPLRLTPKAKSYLHAAAVMASNYLITLLNLSGEIADLGGINEHEARKALQTLVKTTVENGSSANLSEVLSGPVARGDTQTIARHLELLEQNHRLKALYQQLGEETVRIAREKGTIPKGDIQQMIKLFKS